MLATNLDGAYNCIRAAVRGMLQAPARAHHQHHVAERRDAAGRAGELRGVEGGARRAHPRALARSRAAGVLVNAVSPGLVDTDMLASMPEATRQATLSAIAMGRIGAVREIAEVVAFLASDAASYISGQVIAVDGGLT